jgi:hypothetical protein
MLSMQPSTELQLQPIKANFKVGFKIKILRFTLETISGHVEPSPVRHSVCLGHLAAVLCSW